MAGRACGHGRRRAERVAVVWPPAYYAVSVCNYSIGPAMTRLELYDHCIWRRYTMTRTCAHSKSDWNRSSAMIWRLRATEKGGREMKEKRLWQT